MDQKSRNINSTGFLNKRLNENLHFPFSLSKNDKRRQSVMGYLHLTPITPMRKLNFLIIFVLFSTVRNMAQVRNPSRADLEKEQASIQKEIDDVKLSLDINCKNRKQTLGQLALLQKRLRVREASMSKMPSV